MQIPSEIPAWITPLLVAIGGVVSGIITGIAAYKHQGKQLKTEMDKAQTELKKAGTDEFEAINAGNRALREAFMEQIRVAHEDIDRMRKEHEKCEELVDKLYRRNRILARLLSVNNIPSPEDVDHVAD